MMDDEAIVWERLALLEQHCAQLEDRVATLETKRKPRRPSSYGPAVHEATEVVLAFLSAHTGVRYRRGTKSYLAIVNRLLEDGYDARDMKMAIGLKVREWKGTDLERNLNPETLLGRQKVHTYIAEARKEYAKMKRKT